MDVLGLKRLGFSLKKIKHLLTAGENERSGAIETKKRFLQKEIKRIEGLIKSIDQMKELHFEGKTVSSAEIRKQFEDHRNEVNEYKLLFEKTFGSSFDDEVKKAPKYSIEEQKKIVEEKFRNMDTALYAQKTALVMKKIIDAIHQKVKENTKEAQQLMNEYFDVLRMFHPSLSKKDVLAKAICMIGDLDEFTMFFKIHPNLPEFLSRATVLYAEHLPE
jgi:DNA-binding transcriptional MerR regulator